MPAQPWTRRDLLRSCAAATSFCLFGRAIAWADELMDATAAVDHLLLGVADLDRGVAWVEERTGVRAVAGGSHPGVGTRNALLSLGGRRYLEIIAPDPAQTAYNFHIDVRSLAEPRLITWAAAAADVEASAKKAREAGRQVFGPRDGSRSRPDGRTLRWRTVGVMSGFDAPGVEPVPFFIQWAAESPHPSQDSPAGCELRSFEIEHPQAAEVKAALAQLGIAATVKPGETVRLRAALNTPKGEVELV